MLDCAPPRHDTAAIVADLSLQLGRADGAASPFASPDAVALALALHNGSATASHRVVQTDPGSTAHATQPILVWETQVRGADGEWQQPLAPTSYPMPEQPDWRPRVVALGPGERLALPLPSPARTHRLPRGAELRARVQYHYAAYPAPGADRRPIPPPAGLGRMRDVPPFSLTSNWLEFAIR